MGKVKTKKILAKRVKVSGSGKVLHLHVRTSHLKEKQSSKTKRRKGMEAVTKKSDMKKVKRLLPYESI